MQITWWLGRGPQITVPETIQATPALCSRKSCGSIMHTGDVNPKKAAIGNKHPFLRDILGEPRAPTSSHRGNYVTKRLYFEIADLIQGSEEASGILLWSRTPTFVAIPPNLSHMRENIMVAASHAIWRLPPGYLASKSGNVVELSSPHDSSTGPSLRRSS
jgi:hypothetical protein